MLFGVDTSGKIGEGSLYIAVVEHKSTKFMLNLKEKVRSRHRGLAGRRRIKASSLTESELEWVSNNFDSRFSAFSLGINTFSEIRKETSKLKEWKIKVLASCIFAACKGMVKTGDVLLIDRDYSSDVMLSLFRYLNKLFNKHSIKPTIESGTSFNEVITKADLIAGCVRRGKLAGRSLKLKDILKMIEIIEKRGFD